jgi:CRP/FNR family transcriptional regulator
MENDSSSIRSVYTNVFESSLISELEEKSMLFSASAGQELMKMGQPIKVVPIVLSGILRVSRINNEGQELLLYYVRKGEGCAMTFSCGMMSKPSQVEGTVEEDLTMICIPVNVMEELMQKYPSWKKFVMATIVNEFIDVIKSVDEVTFKKMDDRLVNYLKEKSRITESSLINLSHQQIADDMGTNRVVISRLLKKLENNKRVLLYRNQIKLLKDM